jgi:acyl carrier protein
MDKYLNRIIALIVEKTGVDPEEVSDASYFEDDLNISELELQEILASIEEEYQVEFEDDEKEKLESIMDLVELLVEKLE